jgi:hypothetical protein
MKNLIRKILREEFDDFDWIENYNIIPPSDASKNPEFLMKLFQTKLKGKKSFNGYDYIVDEENGNNNFYYFIGEIIPDKTDSHFFYEKAENFNLEFLLNHFLRIFSDDGLSEGIKNEYKKLFDDLGDVFER